LFAHKVRLAFSLAAANAGRSSAARIAIMAMTTNSSIKVKARRNFTTCDWNRDIGMPRVIEGIRLGAAEAQTSRGNLFVFTIWSS
jgi:hypothetical protein